MTLKKYVLTSAVILATTGAALAQQGRDRMGDGMPGMGMMGMGMGMIGAGCPGERGGMMMRGAGHGMMYGSGYNAEKTEDLAEQRLDKIKSELEIGDKQEDAWEAYENAVKDRVKTMRKMHDAMMGSMDQGSAPERLETRIGAMENMLEGMKTMLPATKALYETLPADKQEKANVLLGGCGMM